MKACRDAVVQERMNAVKVVESMQDGGLFFAVNQ